MGLECIGKLFEKEVWVSWSFYYCCVEFFFFSLCLLLYRGFIRVIGRGKKFKFVLWISLFGM